VASDEWRGVKAAVITVGCRLNQSESDALRATLRQCGADLVSDAGQVDVCYVNTCAVTVPAGRRSVQRVRRACRSGRPVVAMGCLAEASPERLRRIAGVAEVWDNARKQAEITGILPAPERSRASLKVQDGCDAGCAYCAPATLRGRPVSVKPEEVAGHFGQLVRQGFAEVVLTGLNLGRYRAGGFGLAALLRLLLETPGTYRVRLASVEPAGFDSDLLAAVKDSRVCPHFHIPLQSGDDRTLGAMGRAYVSAGFAALLGRVKSVRPDANVGVDVIAGFPGEDEASFELTRRFLESAPVDYVHAFPYSPRPGTKAWGLGDPVVPRQKARRVQELRRFSETRRAAYASRFIGAIRPAVLETGRSALTDNYLSLSVPDGDGLRPGRMYDMAIEQQGTTLVGRPVSRCRPDREE
jgi:threonylcarbamoyladenosine tRNA methylthiotransferase MtaB